LKHIVLVFVLTLLASYTAASRDSTQELQDIEDRQGPFSLAGQDFTVVLR
jgi:hypothetical protein